MFTDSMSRLGVGVSVMVALSVALFLTVLLLLLADLFCSHIRLRAAMAPKRPKHGGPASSTPPHTGTADDASVATTATTTHDALSSTPPFYYAHGVMSAPNPKDLLLAIPKLEAAVWRWSPARGRSSPSRSGSTCGSSAHSDGFVCISNPVYERGGAPAAAAGGDTPFETPDASPSPCGITEEEEGELSPPLSMMRKLSPLGVLACPPRALGFVDGRPSLAAWSARSGTVTDTNRASSSSTNLTTHFFSS